jgi:5-methylcytosine-specific restriction endonuclease McrA
VARNVGPACRWTPPTMDPQQKPCRRCLLIRPITDFGRLAHTRDGLSSWCTPCHRATVGANRQEYQRRYRERNGEAIKVRERARYQSRPLRPKPCETCGEVFIPIERNQQRYCSVEHRELRHRLRPAVPKNLRRKVLARDDWTCYLCGGAIPEWVPWPHQLAGTADHVIPWIAGGKGTLDNLRAAHWACNRKKAGRLLEVA